jgi:hypothetical protein
MDMVRHQVPFFYPTFALFGQSVKYLSEVFLDLTEDHLFAVLRDKNDVVLTFPAGMR